MDKNEPIELAQAIKDMQLQYVVITSVDRDDLKDSGAQHFANCIAETRRFNPQIKVEVLVPDFRGRMKVALDVLQESSLDVFNHNLETVLGCTSRLDLEQAMNGRSNFLKNISLEDQT